MSFFVLGLLFVVMQTLPLLHMSIRDWFDDDEFIEDNGDFDDNFNLNDETNNNNNNDQSQQLQQQSSSSSSSSMNNNFSNDFDISNNNNVDENLIQSIKDSVEKLKLVELQNSLKKKGLKSSGSKSILRDRLLRSLLDEAGF